MDASDPRDPQCIRDDITILETHSTIMKPIHFCLSLVLATGLSVANEPTQLTALRKQFEDQKEEGRVRTGEVQSALRERADEGRERGRRERQS